MKKLYIIFIGTVICAPIIFLIYLQNDLVCAPRAILSSAIFGLIPLIILTIAILQKKRILYYFALLVLIIEFIITPIIMINRLGWEKFINERLLAFFTFEGVILIQFVIIIFLLIDFLKSQKNKT